ncbi:hypothetical protein C8035_v006006 [Colletotrichum spinosum]|uniref:Rhodopsin domain-containing protein n=1 Tax=Colletotrichum spinosum TaxID=1347390 RepID=A0A4R8Q3L9_9PEZI|nr:hypothetical protein C8035_v006006 [Colletotrichum spinosum]
MPCRTVDFERSQTYNVLFKQQRASMVPLKISMAMDMTQWPANSYEDRSSLAYGVVGFLLGFSVVIVGLRLSTRIIIKQFGADDWASLITLVSYTMTAWNVANDMKLLICAAGISISQMTRYGLGKHGWTLSEEQRILYQRSFWVSLFFYINTLAVVKITVLLQYYRIMALSNMHNVYIGMIVLVSLWGLGQGIFACVACIPLAGFWDPRINARCIPNAHIAWYISALFNILSDIIILLLPIPALRRLNLPGSQKAFLLGIFSLGFFTVAISALRIKWLTLLPDPTWSNLDPTLWSLGELTCAITCASLATLRPLMTRLNRWFKSRREKGAQREVEMTPVKGSAHQTASATSSVPMTLNGDHPGILYSDPENGFGHHRKWETDSSSPNSPVKTFVDPSARQVPA